VSGASELMLTERFIDACRSLVTGPVIVVVGDDQLDAAAQSYLDDLLAASPVGLRMSKEGLDMAVDDRVSS